MRYARTEPLIFVVVSLSLIALVYTSSSTSASALKLTSKTICETKGNTQTCCHWETDTETEKTIEYCTECIGDSPCTHTQTDVSVSVAPPTPAPSPVTPENALPQGDVQQPTPTPPPTGGKGLFGSNVLPNPPAGLAPPTTTATPSPSPQTTPPPTTGLKGPQGSFLAPEGVVSPTPQLSPGGESGQGRFISPTGGCVPYIRNNCVPCDPGLPGGDCMPSSDWPPPRTTDEGTLLVTPTPTVPPGKPPIGELTPEGGGTQPETQPDESEEGGEEPPVEQPEEEPSNEGQDTAGPLT